MRKEDIGKGEPVGRVRFSNADLQQYFLYCSRSLKKMMYLWWNSHLFCLRSIFSRMWGSPRVPPPSLCWSRRWAGVFANHFFSPVILNKKINYIYVMGDFCGCESGLGLRPGGIWSRWELFLNWIWKGKVLRLNLLFNGFQNHFLPPIWISWRGRRRSYSFLPRIVEFNYIWKQKITAFIEVIPPLSFIHAL